MARVKRPGGARWREIERERGRGRIQYIFGHRRDGTGFLGFVRVADGGADGWAPMNAGWIRRDGQFGGLDAARSRMRGIRHPTQNGRAPFRERGGTYGEIQVVTVPLK